MANLYSASLAQSIKAAKAAGWDDSTIQEVSNLDWTQPGLERLIKSSRANRQQAEALRAVRDAAALQMMKDIR